MRRLLRSFLPHSPLLLALIAATGLYTGMMTVRTGAVYLVARVIKIEQDTPGGGKLIKSLTDTDSNLSQNLKRVNLFLDGLDTAMGDMIRPILPDRVSADPRRFSQVSSLATVVLLFLLMAFLAAPAHFLQEYTSDLLVVRVLISLRIKLLQNLLFQPLAFYNEQRRGELITRLHSDVQSATSCLMTLTRDLLEQPFMILLPVVGIMLISPWLLLLVAGYLAVLMISVRRQSRRVQRRAKVRQESTAKVTESMVQMFSGIRVVKAFGLERQKVSEYSHTNEDFKRTALATARVKAWARARMEFLIHIIMVGSVLVAAVVLSFGGKLSPGLIGLFVPLMVQLFRPIKMLTRAYTDLHDHLAGAERTYEFMDLKPALTDKPGAIELSDVVGSVRFEDICFAYNGHGRVLDHIHLDIPAGQVVALVGPSGAGKSTLVNLVARFYDPLEGRITVDGTDVREVTRESLLRNISMVTQEPFLFNTTIRENIGYGRPGASMDEIVAAAEAANIHEFVLGLPRGYETVVGERGANLSGGQCQRITIARAILRDARILILDEATSSLDTESERAVQLALQNLMKGRTTLVIAHRLSTVQHADKIVVLQDGHIAEMGRHDELLSRPHSLYRRLYEMQFATVG